MFAAWQGDGGGQSSVMECGWQCVVKKFVPICVVNKVPIGRGSRVEELEEFEFLQEEGTAWTRGRPYRAP